MIRRRFIFVIAVVLWLLAVISCAATVAVYSGAW